MDENKESFPQIEEKVLDFWQKNKIFEKTLQKPSPKGDWTFLDGPPFITGLPHYGTLLSSIPKDAFPRFKTMQGYSVRRVWGWDCHGLPAENKVEGKLGLTSKRDIEQKIGVKKFIDECKIYVSQVSSEWQWYVDHVGRWVDFANSYKTMDTSYMETVMWVFKQIYDKGLIYKGLRVSLYCPHDVTPISNFEVAMDPDNYKEVVEPADTYKYQMEGEADTYFLAWSTTPWNKLATPALAVNPKLTYVKVKQGNEYYILAKTTLKALLPASYEVIEEMPGESLIGKKFVPHYDFYKIEPGKKSFVIIGGDFVTAEEGTGIVTIAAYGEEDLAAMKQENIQIVLHVDEEGFIKKNVPQFGGLYYLDANEKVNADLKSRGLVYREELHTHTVPTCWRCHTRLIYAPQDAWYINVQKLKPLLKETNEKVSWFPEHFKYGRYQNSVEAAPDWCISRSRYWGSPVPVWECQKCQKRYVPGSIKELEELSGKKISDLHKPGIDEVVIKCRECGGEARRVSEVLDSWIEAGSAPFAERHFPFEKGLELGKFFPPDFIVEYTGQIRAWFYVLHVIAAALYGSEAFKNVLVTGVILGTDGRKMSKNYGNYPDPKEMLLKYGGDALRLYLLGSPVMHGEDILISEKTYAEQLRFLRLLLNIYNFYETYSQADGFKPGPSPTPENLKPNNILDKWILSRLATNIRNITESLESYDSVEAVSRSWEFIFNDLSNWYVRRLRDRVGPTAKNGQDKNEAWNTFYLVLEHYLRALAPTIPFISESLYQKLTSRQSVHLQEWPVLPAGLSRPDLEEEMESAQKLASKVHALRKENNVPVKIPLITLSYSGPRELSAEVLKIVLAEVNVAEIKFAGKAEDFALSGETGESNRDKVRGQVREFIRSVQSLRKEAGCKVTDKIKIFAPTWPKEFEDYIKKETLAQEIVTADKLSIETLK